MARNDLFTSDVSPPGSAVPRLLESQAVAQLAPVPDSAPVPPQNLEAEESVLGAMMLSPGAIGAVSEILDAGDFYRESHAKIYRAALALYAKGEPVGEFTHIDQLLKESFERITQLYEAGVDVTGTPSGYRDLDRLTSGFQPGNLIIVAARPSMGKSALALCMAANIAVRQNIPVGMFTLEMSKSEVTQRLMCSEAKVESQRLRTGKLAPDDWPRLTAACDKLAKAPIYVDDTGSVTMMEIRSKSRRLKSRHPDLGLIVVDYLQLMSSAGSAENRVQEVSQISRSLKILARDLEVPIVALSQLSRAVEQRTDKRPILSDLRESGSIEQDADLVAFIYRDEYYNDESDQQGLAEVILAKHRNGPTDAMKLSFLKRYAKFSDLAAG